MSRWRLLSLALLSVAVLSPTGGCGGTAVAPGAVAPRARKQEIPIAALWWNRPALVSRFALTDEQRAAMDGARSEFAEGHAKLSNEEQAVRSALAQALWKGDWESARQQTAAVAELESRRERLRTELIIRVLGALTEAQRRRLATEGPRLLNAPW